MLRATFLGTSAAQPTIGRNLSGLAVRHARELLLFDCGEGTQRQMIRYGTGFDVAAIFFTHFHADHYLGAIGFLRTLSMIDRRQPLDLYGPRPARRLLKAMLFAGTDATSFEVTIHEVEPGAAVRGPCGLGGIPAPAPRPPPGRGRDRLAVAARTPGRQRGGSIGPRRDASRA